MSSPAHPKPLVLIGAGGAVGRRLRRAWKAAGHPHVALGRGADADLRWDMRAPPPPCPLARGAGVVALAGVTPETGGDLGDNARLAAAAIAAARDWGAAHVFVISSSAVYGATSRHPAGETAPLDPARPYAAAKIEMERATAAPDVTALRLANVAGASQPFLAIRAGHARLDRFAEEDAPTRSFIGPVALADCLARLCDLAADRHALPPVLNVASRDPLAMLDIFTAAGLAPERPDAPEGAVAHANLSTGLLSQLWEVPAQDAADLWAETRATDEASA